MWAILKFVASNSILPLFDMGTDMKAFFLYLYGVAYHPNWAALTLVWIIVPFLLHVIKFLYHLLAKTGKASWRDLFLHIPFVLHLVKFLYPLLAKTGEASWRDLFLHIPFVLPFRNLYYAYLLHKLGFGKPNFESKNWAAVEAIQNEVARDGLSESYFESGPQAHFSYLSHFFALKYPDLKMLCLKINDKYEIC